LVLTIKGPPRCCRASGGQFAIPRTGAGLDELVARVKVLKPNVIVIEATGAALRPSSLLAVTAFLFALIFVAYSIISVHGFMSTRIAQLEAHKRLVEMEEKDLEWKRATSINREMPKSERMYLRQERVTAEAELKKSLRFVPDAAASSIASWFNTTSEQVQRYLVIFSSCVGQLIKVSCLFIGSCLWPHRQPTRVAHPSGGGGLLALADKDDIHNSTITADTAASSAAAYMKVRTAALAGGADHMAVSKPPQSSRQGMHLSDEASRELSEAADWFVRGKSPWPSIRALAREYSVHHSTAIYHVRRAKERRALRQALPRRNDSRVGAKP